MSYGFKIASKQGWNGTAIPSQPCSEAVFKPYDLHQYQVYSQWTPEDEQRNYPKHVEVHF
jgi:hypothetical protein